MYKIPSIPRRGDPLRPPQNIASYWLYVRAAPAQNRVHVRAWRVLTAHGTAHGTAHAVALGRSCEFTCRRWHYKWVMHQLIPLLLLDALPDGWTPDLDAIRAEIKRESVPSRNPKRKKPTRGCR